MRNLITVILIVLAHLLYAQNNSIFGGGSSDGADQNCYSQHVNLNSSSIYSSGIGRGDDEICSQQQFILSQNDSVYLGGIGDGYSITCKTRNFILATNNHIFNGGNGDGYSMFCKKQDFILASNNDLFNGGIGRGDGMECGVPLNTFIWTGITSSDWQTASNWSLNQVPISSDEILIPSIPVGPFFPEVDFDLTVGNLSVQAGANVSILPGYGLTITEDGNVFNNGEIVLKASNMGAAWLDNFTNNNALYSGTLTVEQYIGSGSGLGQRYIGSPVNNSTIEGLDNTYTGYPLGQIIPDGCSLTQLAPNSPYSNLFVWNEQGPFPTSCAQEVWYAIDYNQSLTRGLGYSGWIADDTTLVFKGPLTNVPTQVLTNTPGPADAQGWHLLANPFPSLMNVEAITTNGGLSSPQTYDASSGAFSGTFQPILPGSDLAIAQGYMAFNSTNGTSFTPSNSSRRVGSTPFRSSEFFDIKIDITVNGNGFQDITYLYYNQYATSNFDIEWDCVKRKSDPGQPTLYTGLNTDPLSLNGQNTNEFGTSVPLGINPGSQGTFIFNFDGITTLPWSVMAFLEDKQTNNTIQIYENFSYEFEMLDGMNHDRFEIHFTQPIEIYVKDESCAQNDGSIEVGLGNQIINDVLLTWDFSLTKDLQLINEGNATDSIAFENLEPGIYDLALVSDAVVLTEQFHVLASQPTQASFSLPTTDFFTNELVIIPNTSSGADNYIWTLGNDQYYDYNFNHVFSESGNYELTLIAENEHCTDMHSTYILVLDKATSLRELEQIKNFKVYLENSELVIDLSLVETKGNIQIEITNTIGQQIVNLTTNKAIERIDLSNEIVGIYQVQIRNNNQVFSRKFILSKY